MLYTFEVDLRVSIIHSVKLFSRNSGVKLEILIMVVAENTSGVHGILSSLQSH